MNEKGKEEEEGTRKGGDVRHSESKGTASRRTHQMLQLESLASDEKRATKAPTALYPAFLNQVDECKESPCWRVDVTTDHTYTRRTVVDQPIVLKGVNSQRYIHNKEQGVYTAVQVPRTKIMN